MGMDHISCSGYILNIAENLDKLNIEYIVTDGHTLFSGMDSLHEAIDEFMSEVGILINGKTIDVFRYNGDNGSRYDDLEDGEIYAIFSEEDLFERKPTALLKKLQELQAEPTLTVWSDFG